MQAEGFAIALTVPQPKHQKSVGRPRTPVLAKSQESHRALCKVEWVKIPKTRIERLLVGYNNGLQAVLLAKGGVTKY